jgi:hypothetical protein
MKYEGEERSGKREGGSGMAAALLVICYQLIVSGTSAALFVNRSSLIGMKAGQAEPADTLELVRDLDQAFHGWNGCSVCFGSKTREPIFGLSHHRRVTTPDPPTRFAPTFIDALP